MSYFLAGACLAVGIACAVAAATAEKPRTSIVALLVAALLCTEAIQQTVSILEVIR